MINQPLNNFTAAREYSRSSLVLDKEIVRVEERIKERVTVREFQPLQQTVL